MKGERAMRPQVCKWLTDKGFIPVFEIHLANFGATDIVAGSFADEEKTPSLLDMIAVELKLTDIAGVLRQAGNNRHIVPLSYAAMPEAVCRRMKKKTLARFWLDGIGLLSVGDTVTEIVEPKRFDEKPDHLRPDGWRWKNLGKRLWRRRNEWEKRLTHSVRFVKGRIQLVEPLPLLI